VTAASEREGRDAAGLVGAIWQVNDHLSLDAGWRFRIAGTAPTRDARVGFTWGIPLRGRKERAS
jgi:hypothetical protein